MVRDESEVEAGLTPPRRIDLPDLAFATEDIIGPLQAFRMRPSPDQIVKRLSFRVVGKRSFSPTLKMALEIAIIGPLRWGHDGSFAR
jgi:hypothetical protein